MARKGTRATEDHRGLEGLSDGDLAEDRFRAWLEDRCRLAGSDFAGPQDGADAPLHVFYYFGGMTLFFFLVQVVTGILLMLYYRPSAEEAFESVEFIMTTVPLRLADPLDPLLVGQPDGLLRLRCIW